MIYQFAATREAQCVLGKRIRVEADSLEEAEQKALAESEGETDASQFTVISIDLSAVEGSSKVTALRGAA